MVNFRRKLILISDLGKKFINNPRYMIEYFKKFYYAITGTNVFVEKYYSKLNLLDSNDTLNQLINEPKSFVRFGDGEMELMLGSSIYFGKWHQKYDSKLQKKLKTIFNHDIYVGVPTKFLLMKDSGLKSEKEYYIWIQMRYSIYKYLKRNKIYLNTNVFRETENLDIQKFISFLKTKNIVLITGDPNAHGVASRLLGKIHFIKAPASDAWGNYNSILESVNSIINDKKLQKESTLFLISLGPTAKPLVLDIDRMGYMAWDSGHFFHNYYKWSQDNK